MTLQSQGGLETRVQSGHSQHASNIAAFHPMAFDVQGKVISNNSADASNLSTVINSYQRFQRKEGTHLARYGTPNVDLANPGSEDLDKYHPGSIAAHAQLKSGHWVFLGDRKFNKKVEQFAHTHGMNRNLAERYVWLHETGHALGNGTEEGAEIFVLQY